MKRLRTGLLIAGCFVCAAAVAGENAAGYETIPGAKNPASAAAKPFAAPVVLTGTLGEQRIQAKVRPKVEFEDGVEGEYFIFGRSGKILLAGEVEGDDIFLEESENGTDVSGQWEGKRRGDTIEGNWLSADGSVSKPFVLRIMAAQPGRSRAKPASSPASRSQ
jgi:hypothetical protein